MGLIFKSIKSQVYKDAIPNAFGVNPKNDGSQDDTRIIPDYVYERLPEFLRKACQMFTDVRERDIFLTAALGILSACFPTVSGLYHNSRVHANLFAFIIARAASGKGVMKWAKLLAMPLHRQIQERNQVEGKVLINSFPKTLFIPADSSAAAFMMHLKQNNESGIVCDSEAETLTNALAQDYAGHSGLYRKAFHHETHSASRKTNFEHTELVAPKLSLVLTGTPGQVSGLMKSVEDGLFSRMLFYTFRTGLGWKNVFLIDESVDYEEHFTTLGKAIADFSLSLEGRAINFTLTQEERDIFNSHFEDMLKETTSAHGDAIGSNIFRLGLISYRFMMLFTILRAMEKGIKGDQLVCSRTDFFNALDLAQVYLSHSVTIFETLTKKQDTAQLNPSERKFYEALPTDKDITRGDAVNLAKEKGIKESSVGNYLSRGIKSGILIKSDYGVYRKV